MKKSIGEKLLPSAASHSFSRMAFDPRFQGALSGLRKEILNVPGVQQRMSQYKMTVDPATGMPVRNKASENKQRGTGSSALRTKAPSLF